MWYIIVGVLGVLQPTITTTTTSQGRNKKKMYDSRVLGFIARNFDYKSTVLMLPLHKSLVRPHLEYAIQFWSPHLRRDRWNVKSIKNSNKIISKIRNHSYQELFKGLELITLVQRRLRGQLTSVFKYRIDSIMLVKYVSLTTTSIIRFEIMEKRIIVKRFNTSVAEHFFIINITTTWNTLPYDVVNSRAVNTLKNRLDGHWEDNPPDVHINFSHRLMFPALYGQWWSQHGWEQTVTTIGT